MTLDNSTKMALGLAAAGLAFKIYAKNSVSVSSDKKPQYDSLSNFALYSGLGLAVLFYYTK
jgi:hypothetical protein